MAKSLLCLLKGSSGALFVLVLLLLQQICAANHEHGHHHLHRRSQTSNLPPTTTSTGSVSGARLANAENVVKRALGAAAILNKARLDHPRFNKYEFKKSFAVEKDAAPGPPPPLLSWADKLGIGTSGNPAKDLAANLDSDSHDYTISPEVVEAARLVSESSSFVRLDDKPASIASDIQKRYGNKVKDTNVPPQTYARPNGLEVYHGSFHDEPLISPPQNDSIFNKRANVPYWMTTMPQRGQSPFAPKGYKVWRNVRDYGAKGDGIADDTAAINKAISDGNRCGENCGSSTIYPAVIYFPPGTYLVSSSVIQYYNTQFLGDPIDYPTILAAPSFVGLGVFSSNVYIDGGNGSEWYLNTNNFLRSIKNFKMDIRHTDPDAYIAAIHWQVAQATSLENIEFYMMPDNTTQQGIFMENGSGGFLTNLTFVGGNLGAYFGNQQFTTSHLAFVNCNTALQIHWDWAWTMHDLIIESCQQGIVVIGGAGGSGSTGQSVGSLTLIDSIIANTPVGIVTSLLQENSTSFLIQNTGFFNVKTAIKEDKQGHTLLPGGNEVKVDSWGFGLFVNSSSGTSEFINGQDIPVMNRSEILLGSSGYHKPNLFTRRAPTYVDIGRSQIFDVKEMGAAGDGVSDDTGILNSILSRAADMSALVYFPFGIYIVKDTLHIPVGSRIIGQAWSQIMATGPKFEDELHPRIVAQVGRAGDVGIIEIQDMMITVSGPTAGAILMQWNVHEVSQGSAAMWNTHFRVGGAIGSKLQKDDCPKLTNMKPGCKAASLLFHMTRESSGYFENIWAWVADHDLDIVTQDQIDIYSARGMLIESQGPTWLYGTASEHNVLYQYQLSGAKNAVLTMIQTESPYYQPTPKAPIPFVTGLFPNDPTFKNCGSTSARCAFSWALRVLDSSAIYNLGAGVYSWFSDYSQDCLKTENCQDRAIQVEQSSDVWFYNIVTKAVVEMVSPVGEPATLAKSNKNGFLSSILAWVRDPSEVVGERNFTGFQMYRRDSSALYNLPESCKTALTETIKCDDRLRDWWSPFYHSGFPGNDTITDSVCDPGCRTSLQEWFGSVSLLCKGHLINSALPTKLGGYVYQGYNETCLKDEETGKYCNDIISEFSTVESYSDMPHEELCSYCYVEKLRLMQSSSYSVFNGHYQDVLKHINQQCKVSGPIDIPPGVIDRKPDPTPICLSDNIYTIKSGDTCDSIALQFNVSSAAIFDGSQDIIQNCTRPRESQKICIPLSCGRTYNLQLEDTCNSIELANNLEVYSLRRFNPWIDKDCANIHVRSAYHGRVLCLAPQGGYFTPTATINGTQPAIPTVSGYMQYKIPPPANATVDETTTKVCGKWYTVEGEESCAKICVHHSISRKLFLAANRSLGEKTCTEDLVVGTTYCVGPTYEWAMPSDPTQTMSIVTTYTEKPTWRA